MSTNEETMLCVKQTSLNGSAVEVCMYHINEADKTNDPLISNKESIICFWVLYAVLCQGIDSFGTTTNIINIICFVKQGFKDPVNVSLLGLAVSDLASLLTLMWTNLCFTPAFRTSDLPFVPDQVQYLIGTTPHMTFTRVSSWITALITLERCLCITHPLQVKTIVTSKRVSIMIICVFTVLIFSVSPVYAVNKLDLTYFPEQNKSLVGLVFSNYRHKVEKVSFAINNLFVPFSAFLIIIVCTVILSVQLKKKTKWREMSTSQGKADNISSRNRKAAKMVVMISSLFIACFAPLGMLFIAMQFETEIHFDGKYRNLLFLVGGIAFILESINASLNIFIYYCMSSKYRATFNQLFSIDKSRA